MGIVKRALAFWTKFGNDWGMNLAGLLAYNFLTAIFPLLLGILALVALVMPDTIIHQIADKLNAAIPSAVASSSKIDFYQILSGFHKASGLTAIISLVGLLWTGSSLFGVMENCFSIVFRTRDRDFVPQKLMAFVMIVLFAILAPLAVLATSISGAFSSIVKLLGNVPGLGIVVFGGSFAIGVLIAFVLFLLIYMIVPNMEVEPRHAWRGAIFAAVLFQLVTYVFPLYIQYFGGKGQFGPFVLLLGVLALWFWVISLILILGAELNSFAGLGQRAMGADLATTVHDVQVHGEAPRAAEDSDAPPAGHPISQRGERIHAREGAASGAKTSEDTAHPPGDRDRAPAGRSSAGDRETSRRNGGPSRGRDRGDPKQSAASDPKKGQRVGARLGWAQIALLALVTVGAGRLRRSRQQRGT